MFEKDKTTFTERDMVYLFNINDYHTRSRDLNTKFKLGNCLCRAVKLNENVDPCKYG